MREFRENERDTLLALQEFNGRTTIEEVSKRKGLSQAAVMRASLSLKSSGLIRIREKEWKVISIKDEGRKYAEKGLPERRLIEELLKLGGEAPIKSVAEKASIHGNLLTIALGWLHRKGWAVLEKRRGVLKAVSKPPPGADEKLLRVLAEKGSLRMEELKRELREAVPILKRRRLVEVFSKTVREIALTEAGWETVRKGIETVEEISQLTSNLIVSRGWRTVKLRRYNIEAPVAPIWPGKKHSYLRFLDELKDKLIGLGFKEMRGPTVEAAFFNFDCLYTPQDHPAREIFDIYLVKSPNFGDISRYEMYVDNVKETHESGWNTGSKGWGYKFSKQEAARLMLRGHGTALSARTLISEDLEIPGKYFSIVRCYRPELVDKTHLSEFNQVEGIVVDKDLTLRDLLGVLSRFAIEIAGADKVRFRPDYFPFTEPSVELSAYKAGYGWMEFGGSGIFRPEVTLPLGVKVPVIAWGLGVDRLFMMKAKINDIRYLFTKDLEWIRNKELI